MANLVKYAAHLLIVTAIFFHPSSFAKQAAVAMPDSYSSDTARAILEQGGNAVDAAIAAQFVLAVTLPEAGNIGGGGFMLIQKDGKGDFIDYRETAPAAAHRDMYLDDKGDVIDNMSVYGIHASGVPGSVAGMWLAHQKHGSLEWKTLLEPAVKLAEQGFIVHPKLAASIERYIARMAKKSVNINFADYFADAKANKVFKQPELAATLKRIRDQGKAGFYEGETAKIIASFMKQHGGIITEQDLKAYQAKSRTPIKGNWRGYEVLTSPPPSSGGIAILQWLKMYDLAKPKGTLEHNSTTYVHILAEVGKRVFADRAEYLGDPDFYEVPKTALLADDYLRNRASTIRPDAISTTENIKPGLHESEQTTHFSILDKWGNAVANTTTINLSFGSGVVVSGAGFILNDEMDDFSAKPGVMNVFGAIGGKANEIQPHKRMLSSMTPTILLQDNKVKMVTGSPGGTTIISSVYESILNAVEFDMTAEQVVDSPRFHHQLWPKNVIRYHTGLEPKVVKALEKMGYTLDERHFGDMHVIINKDGKLDAASEASGRGKAMVF
ncbi:gamma-glutamyltransferase [Pseudoalteromonas sp. S4488]|uniref:gamma-glutamyltransferase n=1 Tax=unclassified Pseudoalteromonas TaxID=194690 RepID=UPI0010230087|nr:MULTISPECIES: gamma-glutamyltransferase [unclassified Pseudoalteromonas]RZF82239.1 gamma-glutamyltransferase [Pseudoalteromonas sp. CO109Y]TMO35591.1 gamma-glutamyltransferase [Pseudoalteromonas sp. S4491]TMO37657.1 gamma-glutamyltransferase [Pseudoalteromonas sp. S4488]